MDRQPGILFGESGRPGSGGLGPVRFAPKHNDFGTTAIRRSETSSPGKHAPLLARAGSAAKLPAVSDQTTTQIKQLLATPDLPSLGPEVRAGVLSEPELNAKLAPLLRAAKLSAVRQELVRSLLLLWHDHLDASHTISQGIETPDGSFIHALMHRREPDYWNAKYWWRRVGLHRTFPEIGLRITESLIAHGAEDLLAQLLPDGGWHPEIFVDLCEQAARATRNSDLLREVQRIETEVLLEQFLSGDPSK